MATTTMARPLGTRWRRIGLRRLVPVAALVVVLALWAVWRVVESRRPFEWSGTVEARDISVGSRVGGRVKAVLVREGDVVQAGQPLVELEPGVLEAQKTQAEGELARAQAQLIALERGARPEERETAQARAAAAAAQAQKSQVGSRPEEIARARAALASAQARLDLAEIEAKRLLSLVAAHAATEKERDAAVSAREAARGERDAARAALVEALRGSRKEDLATAEAQAREAAAAARQVEEGPRPEEILAQRGVVEAAEGRLAAIESDLAELVVRSPAKARIESLDLRPGDLLAPNATAATLLETSELYVRIYVPETQLGHVHLGDLVPVTVDTFGKRAFHGRIAFISGRGEYTPRNLQTSDERANQVFAARVVLEEGFGDLRPGMAAFVRVPR